MLPCIINRMLEKDPEKRISSKDLLTELTKFGPNNYMVIRNDGNKNML